MDRDPFNLERFVSAQSATFDIALAELNAGRKQSHWMWFIFPQLRGLGVSETARWYGVTGLDEARAYLAHPVLALRLDQATRAVLANDGPGLHQIFGSPDDLKFHSSMTLFAIASSRKDCPFRSALDRWFSGRMDDRSLAIIGREGASPSHPSGQSLAAYVTSIHFEWALDRPIVGRRPNGPSTASGLAHPGGLTPLGGLHQQRDLAPVELPSSTRQRRRPW